VKRALEGLQGVSKVVVDLDQERATVEYDPRRQSISAMLTTAKRRVLFSTLRRSFARPRG
jgi:copper chaperone CopZ